MCNKGVYKHPWLLNYAPDWLVTQQQLKICHDDDQDNFFELYKVYKKRKEKKGEIKEGLLPIAWHPSKWWDWCVPEDEREGTEKLFLTTCYAEIKNVLIKEDVEISSERSCNQGHLWTKSSN